MRYIDIIHIQKDALNVRILKAFIYSFTHSLAHSFIYSFIHSRYFNGEEKIKKHTYNFWHGVLADYFESVDDKDRKAEVGIFPLFKP